jgi:hypothetical protein
MPAQRPTAFELVINQHAARAIDVETPPPVLGRTGEV